ncbi:Ras GTPase [Nowakowskiella sp. JEL0078]|nr:Ras GTPase [Nowakowskiella sp. JEL0078]
MSHYNLLREYKIVVVGSADSGKSPLTIQFIQSQFVDEYDPTIEDSYRKQCEIDGEIAIFDILDTTGQEEYSAMRREYSRNGEGFLLVYSITSRASFEEIRGFYRAILSVKNRDWFPVVLVGNNCDLELKRAVRTHEGRELARDLGCKFLETSHRKKINVDEAFFGVVREIRRYESGILEEISKRDRAKRDEIGKRESAERDEIRKLEKAETEAMRKTLKHGMLPVHRMKVVLLGNGRVGKTSLLRALRGIPFQLDEESTTYIDSMDVEQHELDNWIDTQNAESQLFKSVRAKRSNEKEQVTSGAKNYRIPSVLLRPFISDRNFSTAEDFAQLHNKRSPLKNSECKQLVKQITELQSTSIDTKNKTTKTPNIGTTLAVYDFAGQSRYAVFQQIFVTRQAIYLVIFRLDNMFSAIESQIDSTELKIMLSWLSTIHLRAPDAKILLVGTQADKLSKCNLSILEKYIPDAVKYQLIHTQTSDDIHDNMSASRSNFVFLTSAKTLMGIFELRRAIDSAVNASISAEGEKPVDWIRFQDKLASMIASNECPIMFSFDSMMQMSKNEFRIRDENELDVVLRYFHTIGVVLYFPQNKDLRYTVFPNPKAVVNIVASVFHWNDKPPTEYEVAPHNRNAAAKLQDKKIWVRSLLDELWSQFLSPKELPVFIALLKEFDLLCDIEPPSSKRLIGDISGSNTVSIIPCLLADYKIEIQELILDKYSEVVDLILNFPDSVLPTGLFHQLTVRFASNSPEGYVPRVFRHSALVSLQHTELLLQEEFHYGVIRLHVRVNRERMRLDFSRAWMVIVTTVASVISEHWSKSWKYRIAVACPNTDRLGKGVPHGLNFIPRYNFPFPEHIVHCDHFSHNKYLLNISRCQVDLEPLKQFWFLENKEINLGSTSILTNSRREELGYGAVMISYSWGKKDKTTGLYTDQEAVKTLATALEARGFAVWLDVKYMRGDMIAQMTATITNCAAVVACITNDYHRKNSNAYNEFVYACSLDKLIFGIKLKVDSDMIGGAYGFKKGYKDKFYDLSICGSSQKSYNKVLDELAADLSAEGVPRLKIPENYK